jgi:hypothetical protein
MSVPAIDITCDRCNYSGSTGIIFGIFKYQTPFGNISAPTTLGWCNSCESVSPIENTDQSVRFNSLKDDILNLESSLTEEIYKENRSRPFFARLFSLRHPDTLSFRMMHDTMTFLRQELIKPSVLKMYLTLPGDAHCLSCGSSSVFQFPEMPAGLDDFYSEQRVLQPIGVRHPGCGGEMYAATSMIRINRRFSERIYTLFGERLKDKAPLSTSK